ncbi:hypothetical protein Gogos_021608 [Gossypium gossypioides]|uniref:RNase H type-1 domain-containing protein n=1 Tax=Gossypium gossypioides TaxID=34282 RepID=A0A7J9CZM1_GOSGO|nr:hypothetical protein [Gossypium gossypioides]
MSKLLGFIRGYDHDTWLVTKNPLVSSGCRGNDIWRPPDSDIIKLNFDASYFPEKKLTIPAVLARDSRGKVVGADTYLLEDVGDAFVAEARACERALLFASMMGFRRLIVEGDSLTVIKSIMKKEEDRSVLRPIIFHIQYLQQLFEEVTYTYVPRAINRAAHVLALEGRRRGVCGNWIAGIPESVLRRAGWLILDVETVILQALGVSFALILIVSF